MIFCRRLVRILDAPRPGHPARLGGQPGQAGQPNRVVCLWGSLAAAQRGLAALTIGPHRLMRRIFIFVDELPRASRYMVQKAGNAARRCLFSFWSRR